MAVPSICIPPWAGGTAAIMVVVRTHDVARQGSLMRSTRTEGVNTLERKHHEQKWQRIRLFVSHVVVVLR